MTNIDNEKKNLSGKAKAVLTAGVLGVTSLVAMVSFTGCGEDKNKTQSYSVSFSSEFDAFEDTNLSIKAGTKIKDLKDMIVSPVEGYKVVGFYSDVACTKPYDDETVVNENTSIFIKFEIEKFTVRVFDSFSSTTPIQTISEVEYGKSVTLDEPTKPADKKGTYKFAGWVNLHNEKVSLENIKADMDVYASFEVDTYVEYNVAAIPSQVVVSKLVGDNFVKVTDADTLHFGDRIKIVCNTTEGYKVTEFSVVGAEKVDGTEDWYEVTDNLKVTYEEEILKYVIGKIPEHVKLKNMNTDTIYTSENWTSDLKFAHGDVLKVTYIPTEGFHMTEFSVTGMYPLEGQIFGVSMSGDIEFEYAEEVNSADVKFVDEGKVLATVPTVVHGGSVTPPSNPTRPEDDYIYEFDCWVYDNGEKVDLSKIQVLEDGKEVVVKARYNQFYKADYLEFQEYGDGTYMIFGLKDYSVEDIYIPATYNGKKVSYIQHGYYGEGLNNSQIKSVTFAEGWEKVDYSAFESCYNLTTVHLPSTMKRIEGSAFSSTALTTINIPEGIEYVDSSAFSMCDSLNFTVDGNAKYLGNETNPYVLLYSVEDANAMTSFEMNPNTKCLAVRLFSNCTKLESVTFPEGLNSIGDHAFDGCTGLTEVNFSSSITNIGIEAFKGCTGLESVYLPESLKILRMSFNGCTNLKNVRIPNSVEEVDSSYTVFSGCDNLEFTTYENAKYLGNESNPYLFLYKAESTDISSCVIHEDTVLINNYAFSGCSNLTEITIPGNVKFIGYDAFADTTNLTHITIEEGVTTIGFSAFENCSGLQSISIPSTVTYIGTQAFRNCTKLTSITIPSSVVNIDKCAFQYCNGLVQIIIPGSVQTFGNNVFEGCTSLTTVTFEEGVTEIGIGMFSGCTSLSTIIVPNSVTTFRNGAFYKCTSITSFEFSDYVTTLEDGVFSNCSGLVSVVLPRNIIKLGGLFRGCTNLESVVIPEGVKEIGDGLLSGCSKITNIVIPESVTYIGSSAFSGTGITEITIPSGVTYIGDSAFGNTAITEIVIPEGVTYLSGFSGCTGLTSITIPQSVEDIGYYAFSGCTGLTSISIPSGVERIYSGAFSNCSGLSEIVIPEGITNISSETFSGCTGLTSVVIPESVTVIMDNAFANCCNLTSIVIPKNVDYLVSNAFDGCNFSEVTIDSGYVYNLVGQTDSSSSNPWDPSNPSTGTESALFSDVNCIRVNMEIINMYGEINSFFNNFTNVTEENGYKVYRK